jgi:hypothetical protein
MRSYVLCTKSNKGIYMKLGLGNGKDALCQHIVDP